MADEKVIKKTNEAEFKPVTEEALTVERRQEVAGIIDECLRDSGLEFYEAVLGMCDFTSTILTIELSKALGNQEERQASQDRVNAIREPIVDALNERRGRFLAEDMVAIISMLVESVMIGIKREAAAQAESEE